MNAVPFPKDANSVPYYDNKDASNYLAMPSELYIRNASNLFVPVGLTTGLPIAALPPATVTFQSAATSTGDGTAYTATVETTITFEIIGTSTTRTIVFEIAGPSGVYVAQQCTRITDGAIASTTSAGSTTTPESWEVVVPAGWSFRTRISAVTGGSITISGKSSFKL